MENALPDGSPSPEEEVQRGQAAAIVAEALASLTSRQRAVLLMRHRDDMTFAAIGVALSITAPAAFAVHARGCGAVRRWLAVRGIDRRSI